MRLPVYPLAFPVALLDGWFDVRGTAESAFKLDLGLDGRCAGLGLLVECGIS